MGKKLGIPLQIHVHISYADIYHFKAAIEKAKGTDDINKLIKAMEEVETVYSLGKMKFETRRIKPYFHSRVLVDPNNPYQMYPGVFLLNIAQFQNDGKISWVINEKSQVVPGGYVPPAQLRAKK